MQHNIKKMYDPNYKETLSEEEVLKTIAVSLVVNGGMRLGTNISKGVYETDADGMLKPLDEARMMGQMPKGADEPKIMDMEGDESGGLSGMFQEVEGNKSGIPVDDSDIINKDDFGKYSTLIDDKVQVLPTQNLDARTADSFMDQNYRTVVTTEEITVYRTFGGRADAGGNYATVSPATSRIDAKLDVALLPQWGNTRAYEAKIAIPKGTTINIGKVASQTVPGTGTVLRGGVDQVLLPKDWPLEWITEIKTVSFGR